MIKNISKILIFVVLISFVYSSQNPYLGKINLPVTKQTIQIIPLSQQPKVANIQNSLIEMYKITTDQACLILNKDIFRGDNYPPVFIVINFEGITNYNCNVMQMLRIMRTAGAYGFLIVTNNQNFAKEHCRMFDDNKFFVGVINSQNFKKLQKQKEAAIANKNQQGDRVYGVLSIELRDSNLKLLQFWGTSLNRQTYEQANIMSRIFEKYPSIKDNVKWRPRFAILGCSHGADQNICKQQNHVSSCACKGKFCSPQEHKRTPNVIIRQDIRQMQIFKTYSTKYFKYMAAFLESCFDNYLTHYQIENCAQAVMMRVGIQQPSSINKKIDDLLQKCTQKQQDPVYKQFVKQSQMYNAVRMQKDAWANYRAYPLVLVNKQIVDHDSQNELAAKLCKKLELKDSACYQVVQKTVIQTTVSTVFYILIVITLMIIGGIVVYCYRKKLKRDMSKEIKMQVSTAVDHYYALSQIK